MNQSCHDTRWVDADLPPSLSEIVQAVQFSTVLLGAKVKVVVLAELLIGRFGATEDDPRSWLAAVDRHRNALESLAVAHFETGQRTIIVIGENLVVGPDPKA